MPLSKGGRMAEKEETITVAVRLPMSQVTELRARIPSTPHGVRNMSDLLRLIVAEWITDNV